MSKRILIVEDQDDLREILRHWLAGFGLQVIEAHDGQEALECVQWADPDLIPIDMGLPKTDGVKVIERIRKSGAGNLVPVIAMTGYVEWYREKALIAGCNKIISKPVDFDFLRQLLGLFIPLDGNKRWKTVMQAISALWLLDLFF